MGDRANIKMVYEDDNVIFFYTHWSGSELPEILQSALIRGKGRWSDEPYLARIIFSEMIQNEVMSETGYGISPYLCDNEHPIICVSCESQLVWLEDEDGNQLEDKKWSFEEYINR